MQRLQKRDAIAALALFLLVLVLGAGLLDRGHEWGDDFAAYMLQARAIANGTMEEQSHRNRLAHPSELSFGEGKIPQTVTYVWGYPLVLAGVYKAVGYNPMDGGFNIAYKLPNLIAYALFVVIVYLFYRRRFSFEGSLFLSLLFALHTQLIEHVNTLMSDVFCLTLSMAALLLIEIFLECGNGKKKACIGVVLGAVLWYNYEVRLNGVTVIYIVLLAHAVHLMHSRPAKDEWAMQLTPYAVLLVLLGISLCVMPRATSNLSHIASGPNSWIAYNMYYYRLLIQDWLARMVPEYMPLRDNVHFIVYGMIVVGVLFSGLLKNLHLTVLMFGTFIVLLLLPYIQPIRYLFNILPLLLLFAGYGMQFIWKWMKRVFHRRMICIMQYTGYAVMLMCVFNLATGVTTEIREHDLLGGMSYRNDVYADDALEIYQYILENIDEEALIACSQPRALMLNTGRNFYMPGVNGNQYKDMDYLLSIELPEKNGIHDSVTESIWPELWEELTEVYRNDSFVLYELSENYRLTGETE